MEPLKVFISSVMRRTLEDLTAEREAARDAVDSFRPISDAWAFEKEPASTKPLRDSYIEEVKNCDLLLLIVGHAMTAAVRQEFDTARDYQKPILAFAKDVDREPKATKVLQLLDAKYDSFTDASDLREKVQAALGQEILRLTKSGSTEPFRPGDRAAKLRAFASKRKIVRVSPLVPPSQYDRFIVCEATSEAVRLERHGIGESVSVPNSRIDGVLVTGDDEPPTVILEGRLQWITLDERWRFFPEKPITSDSYRLGLGHAIASEGPTVDPILARLRNAGREPVWKRAENIDEVVTDGGEVYYGEDGRFLSAGDLILCVKRAGL